MAATSLSAMEKEDNEALAVLRARHERTVLTLAEAVRYGQWQEAIKAREGVERSIQNAAQRYTYYERLLGRRGSNHAARLWRRSTAGLDKLKLAASEPEVVTRRIVVDIAEGADAEGTLSVATRNRKWRNPRSGADGSGYRRGARCDCGSCVVIPEIGINIQPFGCGGDVKIGGAAIAGALQIAAGIARGVGAGTSYEAGRAAKIGGYARREQDWAYQSNLAAGEITQLFRQLRAAQIREAYRRARVEEPPKSR